MILKPVLHKTLAASLALSFALSPLSVNAQVMNRQDVVSLLIASLSAPSADQARQLIEQARILLPNENLSASDAAAINTLMDQAIQNYNVRPPSTVAYDVNGDPVPQVSQGAPDPADVLRLQMGNAPAIQTGVRSLGEMRLLRDSQNVDQNVTTLTGQSPNTYDQRELLDINQANQPGELLAFLKARGLIRTDFSADNKALEDQYKGASLDVIADKVIARSLLGSTVAGASRSLITILGQNFGAAGGVIQTTGAFAGLTIESAATFIINANLTLQIADLYGTRLNSYEQEVAVLAVFAMAKIGVGTSLTGPDFQTLIGKVATRFADARTKRPGNSGFNFLGHLLNNPMVARNLKNSGLVVPKQDIAHVLNVAAGEAGPGAAAPIPPIAPGAVPPAPVLPGAAPVPPPIHIDPPVQPVIPGQVPHAPGPGHVAPPGGAPPGGAPHKPAPGTGEDESKPSKTGSRARTAIRTLVVNVLRIGFASAWANIETRVVGYVARRTFRTAHERERATQNELFRQFLLSPSGDGFFKLIILSINVGKPMAIPDDFQNPKDSRAKFVLNLARSARICSPLDAKQWLLAKSGTLDQTDPAVRNILRYDCDNGLSQARYVRVKTEFETFNEIPQDFVTGLRVASRENRLRMGELILQLQFLDGDRSPAEVLYFNDIVSKYLGFSTPDDMDYFSRLHSFIVDNGGMVEAAGSPTGYTIGSNTSVNPYDLNLGYTPTNGPEATLPLLASTPVPATIPVPVPPTIPIPGTIPTVPNGGITPGAPNHPPINPPPINPAVPQAPGTSPPHFNIPGLGNYFGSGT